MKLDEIFSALATAAFHQKDRQDQPSWMTHLTVLWEFARVSTADIPFDEQGSLDRITVHLRWIDTRLVEPSECQFAVTYPRSDWGKVSAEALIKDAISQCRRHHGLPMYVLTSPAFRPEVQFT